MVRNIKSPLGYGGVLAAIVIVGVLAAIVIVGVLTVIVIVDVLVTIVIVNVLATIADVLPLTECSSHFEDWQEYRYGNRTNNQTQEYNKDRL